MKLLKTILTAHLISHITFFFNKLSYGQGFITNFIKKLEVRLIICFYLISLTAFSQGSSTGCLLPDNRVYNSKGLLGTYYNNAFTSLSTGYCNWSPSSGPTCYVCNGGLNILGACLSGTTSGIEGTFTMVACPFDDYASILTLIAAGTGAFYIYRKRLV